MTRWILPIALVLLSACATAGPGAGGADVPDPDTVAAASAGLEEAGLADGLSDEFVVPTVELEELTAPRTPGGFLYPQGAGLPDPIQREVEQFIHAFTEGRAADTYRLWLEREAVWGDWIRARLRAADLPEDLVYLAMIESGFHPTAVSHAGATGMWQFMPATARISGLRVDDWVDQRRDPVAATRAAIRHLSELYDATGDWALAASAYNAGLTRVTRAQGRSEDDDYYSLSMARLLPRETRSYVPIILAAAWLDTHRPAFGLPPREPATPPAADSLAVEGRTRLSALAAALAVPADTLKAFNPHLIRRAVPPDGGFVRVPAGTDTTGVIGHLATLSRDERLLPDWMETRYTVRSGDSWWAIARRHDTTVDRLRRLNPRRGDVIHPGDHLVVRRVAAYDRPGRIPVASAARSPKPAESEPSASARSTAPPRPAPGDEAYTVRAGDTMTGIARRLDVSPGTLAEWNDMEAPRPLRTGETLRLAPPAIRYRVRAGDTMTAVARRYRVSIDDLAKWNRMEEPRPLRLGEVLLVPSAGSP